MQHRPCRVSPRRIACAAFIAAGLAGCNHESFSRYPVKGKVTFAGNPVESGMIIFEPTQSAGHIAPTVYVPISNGRFDVGGEGPGKGRYQVTVAGFDRKNERRDSDGMLHTPNLFPNHRFEIEIPPPDNVLDIDVPAARPEASRR